MRQRPSPERRLGALTGLFLFVLFAGALAAGAHDMEHDNVSPEVGRWVMSLTNKNGVACCATADGWTPAAVQWDMTTKGYKVMIENKWVDVPDDAAIHGPNKLGHAEVWYYHVDGLPAVRCFLPGEEM